MIRKLGLAAVCALTFAILDAAQAGADVTVSPSSIPQGTDDVILTFRVPNESTTAAVTGLKIQFPLDHPIVLLNPEAGSGWQVSVIKAALPKPITTDDGSFTSTTSEIDWTGNTIEVGQFGEFNVLAQGIPTGTSELVFKAIQTYSDGTAVPWIQVPNKTVPNPEHPAPIVTLTAASGASGSGATTTTAAAAAGSGTATAARGDNNAVSIAALILAVCAVLLGLLAVWLSRPRVRCGRRRRRGRRRRPSCEHLVVRLDRVLDLAGPQLLARSRGPAARRRGLFRVPAPPGRVVFLGDSITEGGLWEELFPDLWILNRGIGGDTTVDLRERLDDAINEPRVVSLLIGTNDLHGPRPRRDLDAIAARCQDIVERVRDRAPGVGVILNSVMPRHGVPHRAPPDAQRSVPQHCAGNRRQLHRSLARIGRRQR